MRKLFALLAGLVLAFGMLMGTSHRADAASTSNTHKCVGKSGGDFFNGYSYTIQCSGSRFKTNKHKYRTIVSCDRAGWQDNILRYGPWQWNNAKSTAVCSAIGDMGITSKWYEFT